MDAERLRRISDDCAYRSGLIESPIWYDLALAALGLAKGRPLARRIVMTLTRRDSNGQTSTVTFGA